VKSILFTVLKDKLLSREKKQTCRTTFIPKYEIGEIVMLKFKENGIKKDLYPVKITDIYPKQIKDLTISEALLDGFKNSMEFKQKIMELNHLKSLNQWCFIIRWEEYFGVLEK